VREVEVVREEEAGGDAAGHEEEGGGASGGGEEKEGGGGDGGKHEKGASGVSKAGSGSTVKKKDDAKEGEKIRMSASCAVCGAETPRVEMSDGT
jgi:hypothetical protein